VVKVLGCVLLMMAAPADGTGLKGDRIPKHLVVVPLTAGDGVENDEHHPDVNALGLLQAPVHWQVVSAEQRSRVSLEAQEPAPVHPPVKVQLAASQDALLEKPVQVSKVWESPERSAGNDSLSAQIDPPTVWIF
jgi:hypothetical protein